MNKHTPGHWRAVHYDIQSDKAHTHVASVSHLTGGDSEAKADAYLIAAAPDLLEACQNALLCMDANDGASLANAAESMRKAVAKATGEP